MQRMTERTGPGSYRLGAGQIEPETGGFSGPAVDRLAAFENLYEELQARQQKIEADMERLRQQGKQDTFGFKDLLRKKVQGQGVLTMLEQTGP